MHFDDVLTFKNWIENERRFTKSTTIERMKFYASLFDNPQNSFLSIHVTGTNGKGSTVAYLRTIFEKKGLKVGTFTSPYITIFNERIYYNHHYISDEDLLYYANLILDKYDLIDENHIERPTFFDFITLLCFLYFRDQRDLDIAVIEVGMGGRLDATNIINPLLSVITNVSYDHMEQLGNTLELITLEKLGIVKKCVPLITSIKENNLLELCKKKCNELSSELTIVDFNQLKIKKVDLERSTFDYKTKTNVEISLNGFHQIENACLIIDIIECWNKITKSFKQDFYISDEILYDGLISTKWPGRFELMNNNPLIYIDGGHNIGCINRICEFITSLNFKTKRCVVAISSDKEKEKMIEQLDKTFDELIFTHFTYKRSSNADALYEMSHAKNKILIEDIDDVINYVYNHQVDFTLFIGSLYFISEIRPKLMKN